MFDNKHIFNFKNKNLPFVNYISNKDSTKSPRSAQFRATVAVIHSPLKIITNHRAKLIKLDEDFLQMRPAFEEVDKEDKDEEEGGGKEGEVEEEDGDAEEDEEEAGPDQHRDKHVTHWKPDQGEGEGKRLKARPLFIFAFTCFILLAQILKRKI